MTLQRRFDFNAVPCPEMSPMLTPPTYDPGPIPPRPWDPEDLTPEEREADRRFHAEAARVANIGFPDPRKPAHDH